MTAAQDRDGLRRGLPSGQGVKCRPRIFSFAIPLMHGPWGLANLKHCSGEWQGEMTSQRQQDDHCKTP